MKIISVIWLEHEKKFVKRFENDFKEYCINIIPCETSAQARKQLDNGVSNFLLLDVEFPIGDRDGIEFLETLEPGIKTIVLTNYPKIPEISRLFRSGKILDYMEKCNPAKSEERRRLIFEIRDRFLKDETDINDENILRSWRLKSWYQILSTSIILTIIFTYFLYRKNWSLNSLLIEIKENIFITTAIAIVWVVIEIFLIKNLYDKIHNYPNINNYLNRVKSRLRQ